MVKLVLLFLLSLISAIHALECWKCESAQSEAECMQNGYLQTCPSEEDTCESVVRRENGLTLIFKNCKQQKACHNHMAENQRTCNPRSAPSRCTCCCSTDSCNMGEQSCDSGMCPAVSDSFPHGEVSCSDTNNATVGSVCEFQCTERGYEIYPTDNSRVECLSNGAWDRPKPCCSMPCPPHVLFDTIALAHGETNETYKHISDVGRHVFRNLVVSPTNGTMYAKVDFSGVVHETGRISFYDTLYGTYRPDPYINTPDGKVNIGHALTWTLENMMKEEFGERPRVRDVVLLGTDTESDDDVTEGVQAWLDRGAIIYAMLFPNEQGEYPSYEKMLEITRNPEHVFYFEGDLDNAVDQIYKDAFKHLCDNVCNHVLHDHE